MPLTQRNTRRSGTNILSPLLCRPNAIVNNTFLHHSFSSYSLIKLLCFTRRIAQLIGEIHPTSVAYNLPVAESVRIVFSHLYPTSRCAGAG